MPLDLNCPKCQHAFPVLESRQPVGVECPHCDTELTAEFRKRAAPMPGESPFELLVTEGRPADAPPPSAAQPMRLDEENEERSRGGGSMTIVVIAGLGAFLVAIGALGAAGYVLFTNLDTSDSTIGSIGSGTTGTNPKGNTNTPGPRISKGNKGTKGVVIPGTPDPEQWEPPPPPKKKADTFELKPVSGPLPAIAEPPLPADPSNVPLPGRVGTIAVGGGGRYLVLHFPDQGKLGIFDAATARFNAADADPGDARLAAGLSRAVLYVPGPKVFRVYSLPDLGKEFDASVDLFFGVQSMVMGSRTNGPLLVDAGFGEVRLYDIAGAFTEIEGAMGKPPGIHSSTGGLRASPDGTAFATFDGVRNDQRTSILTAAGRKWKVSPDVGVVPFPGGDGNFYGNGVVLNRNGQDQRFGGIGAASDHWFVPAVSGNTYFLKVAPATVGTAPRDKKTITVTVHANKKSDTPVVGTPALTDLPEFEGFRDIFSTRVNVVLDQHLFLVPEAKLLVILPNTKDRLVLRKVDSK